MNASRDAAAPAPRAPRVLNPETGETVPDLTLRQRMTLGVVSHLGRPLIMKWVPRQLLKVLTIVATAIGASEGDTRGTVAFIVAGLIFLLEMGLSWLARRFLKLKL